MEGQPIELQSHGWEIAAGEGGVWISSDADASVTRLDPARAMPPIVIGGPTDPIGPAIAVGFGFIWTGDSDERAAAQGQTVSRIDPHTNRVTKRVVVGRSPQSIATGQGAVWAANHDDGTTSRIDPSTLTTNGASNRSFGF